MLILLVLINKSDLSKSLRILLESPVNLEEPWWIKSLSPMNLLSKELKLTAPVLQIDGFDQPGQYHI